MCGLGSWGTPLTTEGNRTGCLRIVALEDAKRQLQEDSGGYQIAVNVWPPSDTEVFFVESTPVKEGVWNGLLQEAAVLATGAPSLLGKYIMLSHPQEGSEPAWPDENIGQIYRVSLGENGELKILAAMWTSRIPPDLLARFQAGDRVGVSVGMKTYKVLQEGIFKGVPFSAIAKKVYFDHVAIVVIGACKVEDGCDAHMIPITQGSSSNLSSNAEAGSTDEKKEQKSEATNSGVAGQANQGLIEIALGGPDSPPPPLFKSPEELVAFATAALAIQGNEELRQRQIDLAFDFVMNTVTHYGWMLFDIQDPTARATAMAQFVAKAAAAWGSGDPMFSPQSPETVAVLQSKISQSWRGDARGEVVTQSKDEKKVSYKYPILSKTDDGKTEVKWGSTEDEKEATKGVNALMEAQTTTLADMEKKVAAGAAADNIARTLLMTGLKSGLPNLSDGSLEKYKSMDLVTLAGIVGDLGSTVPAGAGEGAGAGAGAGAADGAGAGAGISAAAAQAALSSQTNQSQSSQTSQQSAQPKGGPSPGSATQQNQGPTAVNLQNVKGGSKLSGAEAIKRLNKQLGVKVL